MQIDTVRDALFVRIGATFAAPDVTRVQEAIAALEPSRLTIDFAAVRRCDDAALARLGKALMSFARGEVTLRGLTVHQWRLLTYLGVHFGRSGALSAAS
jgi:anti-anti-sigma regulatory factor